MPIAYTANSTVDDWTRALAVDGGMALVNDAWGAAGVAAVSVASEGSVLVAVGAASRCAGGGRRTASQPGIVAESAGRISSPTMASVNSR